MFISRIKPNELIKNRLEAEYYDPIKLSNLEWIPNWKHKGKELLELCDFITDGTHQTPDYVKQGEVFLSGKNIMDGWIDPAKTKFITSEDLFLLNKNKCVPVLGDILMSKNGKIGTAAVYQKHYPKCGLFVSVALLRHNSENDPQYVSAVINSKLGFNQFIRSSKTGVITNLHLEEIKETFIPQPSKTAQVYIGNKFRQAELLREWAKSLEDKFVDTLKCNFPEAFENHASGKKHTKAVPSNITYTLNPGAFNEERLRVQHYLLKNKGVKLSSMVNISGETTSSYLPETTYIGLNSIESNSCQLSPSTIGKENVTGASRLLPEGPVVAKLRPYLNKVSYIPKWLEGSVGSTELLCVQPKGDLSAWYLYGVLKSEATLKQIKPVATGATHPRIDKYDLSEVIIPVVTEHESLGLLLEKSQKAYFESSRLTEAAKLLVESLIEGKVTEIEIITAQQDLENEDNTKDKAILSKLTDKGYAVKEAKPLFTDLDGLYELLEEALQDKAQY